MKSFRRHPATVNAGSMADIAFLLLIFFLVTTTISADKGILRQLPSDCPNIEDCIKDINERNILRINLNSNQEIFIEDKVVKLEDVEQIVKAFVDNNGALDCDYCYGEKLTTSSDHPKEAVISLSHDALTKYYLFLYKMKLLKPIMICANVTLKKSLIKHQSKLQIKNLKL